MKWLIVTCDASAHIRPVQEWLFRKYAPDEELHYIDVKSEPVETWGANVYNKIKHLPRLKYVVFGLDDYLPTAPLIAWKLQEAQTIIEVARINRFEIGYGASNKASFMKNEEPPFEDRGSWLLYRKQTPYSVSCQFSVWDFYMLKTHLGGATTPWQFETKCKTFAGCFPKGQEAFRWIEESALSGKKWPGKINVNGLPAEDVEELIKLGLLDESKLINRS